MVKKERINIITTRRIELFDMDNVAKSGILSYNKQDLNLYSISELYHENSKLNKGFSTYNGSSVPAFFENTMQSIIGKPFVSPIDKPEVPLHKELNDNVEFFSLVNKRSSSRIFLKKATSSKNLSTLLYYSYGLNRKKMLGNNTFYFRPVPSAGGLSSLNLYLTTLNVNKLDFATYFYNSKNHSLNKLSKNSVEEILSLFPEDLTINIEDSCAVIYLTTDLEKIKMKYGDRGYRYALQESGHLGQQIHLVCEQLGLGAVCLGGYFDSEINNFLKIDGCNEAIIYVIVVGYSKDGKGDIIKPGGLCNEKL